jgi:phosphotriesterase-related protein
MVDFQRTIEGSPDPYSEEEAIAAILPELEKLKAYGVQTIAECTPAHLGRNVELLKKLSARTGIRFITNTGFYGAKNNRFVPREFLFITADSLASIWINEFRQGIGSTGIKPGFIKIGVNRKPLSEFHARLTRAAAITHKATGLTIMSHCGLAVAALQQLAILKEEGVSPQAFIWLHASDEKNWDLLLQSAREGCWISLDKYGWKTETDAVYPVLIDRFKTAGLLDHVLISQDAGFFDPGQPEARFKPYTTVFEKLIPKLREQGFTDKEIDQLFVKNPAKAFVVHQRLL